MENGQKNFSRSGVGSRALPKILEEVSNAQKYIQTSQDMLRFFVKEMQDTLLTNLLRGFSGKQYYKKNFQQTDWT